MHIVQHTPFCINITHTFVCTNTFTRTLHVLLHPLYTCTFETSFQFTQGYVVKFNDSFTKLSIKLNVWKHLLPTHPSWKIKKTKKEVCWHSKSESILSGWSRWIQTSWSFSVLCLSTIPSSTPRSVKKYNTLKSYNIGLNYTISFLVKFGYLKKC